MEEVWKSIIEYKWNNRILNLRYGTKQENSDDRGRLGERYSKLLAEHVIAIKEALCCGVSPAELAEKFKVSKSNIEQIWRGKTWRHVKIEEGVF